MYVKMLLRNMDTLVNMPIDELEVILRDLNDEEREKVIRAAIERVHEQRRKRGELATACARGRIERFPGEYVKLKRDHGRTFVTGLCTKRPYAFTEMEDLYHALAHVEELRRFQKLIAPIGAETHTVAANGLCAVRTLRPRVAKRVTICVLE